MRRIMAGWAAGAGVIAGMLALVGTARAHDGPHAPPGFEMLNPAQREYVLPGPGEGVRVALPSGWTGWTGHGVLILQEGLGLTEAPRVQVRYIEGRRAALDSASGEADRLVKENPSGAVTITQPAHEAPEEGRAWAEFSWEGLLPMHDVPTAFKMEQYYQACDLGVIEVVLGAPAGVWATADRQPIQTMLGQMQCAPNPPAAGAADAAQP